MVSCVPPNPNNANWELREVIKKKTGKSGQADRFYFVKILTHFILYKMAKIELTGSKRGPGALNRGPGSLKDLGSPKVELGP